MANHLNEKGKMTKHRCQGKYSLRTSEGILCDLHHSDQRVAAMLLPTASSIVGCSGALLENIPIHFRSRTFKLTRHDYLSTKQVVPCPSGMTVPMSLEANVIAYSSRAEWVSTHRKINIGYNTMILLPLFYSQC